MNPLRTLVDYSRHLSFPHGLGVVVQYYPLMGRMFRRPLMRRVIRSLKPFVRFGFPGGLRVRRALSSGAEQFNVPGLPAPLHLRQNTSDAKVFHHVFLNQSYRVCLPTTSPRCIIDAGANVGLASVYFAWRYPNAVIYAIEPDRDNFRQLSANVRAYPNVVSVEAAVWAKEDCSLTIDNPQDGAWAFRVRETRTGETGVPAVTIAELLERSGYQTIDLLKMDVEGAEEHLFGEGCDEWLRRVRVLIIELHDWIRPGISAPFIAAVRRHDFKKLTNGEDLILFNQRLL